MASVSSSSGNSNVDNGRTPIQYEVHRTFCTKELVRTIASGVFVTLGLITAITGGSVFFSLNASLTVGAGVVFLIIGIAMTVLGIYLVYSKRATVKALEVVDHASMEIKEADAVSETEKQRRQTEANDKMWKQEYDGLKDHYREAEASADNVVIKSAQSRLDQCMWSKKLKAQAEMQRLERQFLEAAKTYKRDLQRESLSARHDARQALLEYEKASAVFHVNINPEVRSVMDFGAEIDVIDQIIKSLTSHAT